jgi:competence protein ComEC
MTKRVGAVAAVSALVLMAGSASAAPQRSVAPTAAEIVFVDVGAGDGVVIRVGGAVVLSDIGEQNIPFLYKALDKALAKTGSREIEAIILSHAHDDHVKNFALLLKSGKYTVKQALLSRNAHWTATDANRAVMKAIRDHRVPFTYVRTGQVFRFGGAKWTILNPSPGAFTKHHQVSNSSVAYALEVNGKRFLFTGDVETAGERAVVSEWQGLELGSADVLLATHHGSKHASHDFFLDAVKPKSAVISVNRGHGHPDLEAIHRLRSAGAAIWCTAWNGTVTATVPAGPGKVRLRSSENSAPWWSRGERRSRGTCVDQSP